MKNQNHDEIDLLKLLDTLWHGKWKMLSFIIIPAAVLFIYKAYNAKIFTATTLIFPMSEQTAQKYELFNMVYTKFHSMVDLSSFTSVGIHQRFIDKIQDVVLIREAIIKSNLLKIDQYKNEKKYNEKVANAASRIKIKVPVVISKPFDGEKDTKLMVEDIYPTITFDYDNKSKWIETMSILNSLANQAVKNDIEITLEAAIARKQLELKFKKERVQIEINNALSDYDGKIQNRLLYLEEQSLLARKLGIAKSTSTKLGNVKNAINANTKGSTVLEIINDRPYYLNGYEAIDEEMSLIKQRKNKAAFVESLMSLKQLAREYEQDKEVEQLEMMVNLSDMDGDNFLAGVIDYNSTQFKYENNRMLYLLLILVGGMTGALFVLFSDAFQRRKENS